MVKRLFFYLSLALLLASCAANRTATPLPTIPGNWQEIPVMPSAVESNESISITGYLYTINADIEAVTTYYLREMKNSGWELLGKGDMSRQDFEGVDLWYVKGDKIVTIQVWVMKGVTHVALVPEP